MRWVFFSLLTLNVVYLVFSLVVKAAAPSVPAVSSATAPESLVLLRERGLQGGAPATLGAMPALCPVVGPWPDEAAAERGRQTLQRAGYAVAVKQLRVARDRLNWVYLPPAATREEALRTLRQLQSQGVDSFIVSEGGDANAISLGYFSGAESARGLMVKMRTSGYPAEVRETAREVTEYWLEVAADGIPDDGQALRTLLSSASGVTGKHVGCQSSMPASMPISPSSSEGL